MGQSNPQKSSIHYRFIWQQIISIIYIDLDHFVELLQQATQMYKHNDINIDKLSQLLQSFSNEYMRHLKTSLPQTQTKIKSLQSSFLWKAIQLDLPTILIDIIMQVNDRTLEFIPSLIQLFNINDNNHITQHYLQKIQKDDQINLQKQLSPFLRLIQEYKPFWQSQQSIQLLITLLHSLPSPIQTKLILTTANLQKLIQYDILLLNKLFATIQNSEEEQLQLWYQFIHHNHHFLNQSQNLVTFVPANNNKLFIPLPIVQLKKQILQEIQSIITTQQYSGILIQQQTTATTSISQYINKLLSTLQVFSPIDHQIMDLVQQLIQNNLNKPHFLDLVSAILKSGSRLRTEIKQSDTLTNLIQQNIKTTRQNDEYRVYVQNFFNMKQNSVFTMPQQHSTLSQIIGTNSQIQGVPNKQVLRKDLIKQLENIELETMSGKEAYELLMGWKFNDFDKLTMEKLMLTMKNHIKLFDWLHTKKLLNKMIAHRKLDGPILNAISQKVIKHMETGLDQSDNEFESFLSIVENMLKLYQNLDVCQHIVIDNINTIEGMIKAQMLALLQKSIYPHSNTDNLQYQIKINFQALDYKSGNLDMNIVAQYPHYLYLLSEQYMQTGLQNNEQLILDYAPHITEMKFKIHVDKIIVAKYAQERLPLKVQLQLLCLQKLIGKYYPQYRPHFQKVDPNSCYLHSVDLVKLYEAMPRDMPNLNKLEYITRHNMAFYNSEQKKMLMEYLLTHQAASIQMISQLENDLI